MAILHVMSANLQNGRPSRKSPAGIDSHSWKKQCVENTARQLGLMAPDIIAFQEITDNASGGPLYSRILAEGNFVSSMFVPARHGRSRHHATRGGEARGSGIALASAYPIIHSDVIDLPSHHPEESWLRTLTTKLHVGEISRNAIFAHINVAGQPLLVAATHIAYTYPVQQIQLRVLEGSFDGFARRIGLEHAPRLILGDLNARPSVVEKNIGYPEMARALTYPSLKPETQIDHILGRGVKISNAENTLLPVSDHRAIRANISLPVG